MNNTMGTLRDTESKLRSIHTGNRIMGMNVIESPYAVSREQFRFPRTKKKRIQKKWRSDLRNFKDKPCAYLAGNSLYAHPVIYKSMRLLKNIAGEVQP